MPDFEGSVRGQSRPAKLSALLSAGHEGHWKSRLVALVAIVLGTSFVIFLLTGYSALYWAWPRGKLAEALPYLPWARNSGALAIAAAFLLLAILFAAETFPLPRKARLWLSLLAAVSIAFFAEFRNEGKFYFKGLHHFLRPGTWAHDGLDWLVPQLGGFLYRIEYSHWNDFLMGPAIVSVIFPLAFMRFYAAVAEPKSTGLRSPDPDAAADIEQAARFARIFMSVGLFWFFAQAWAEKGGYLPNPHSADEIDLPFEFAGTALGFWMVRVLTKLPDDHRESFYSTLLIDFVSAGVIGLLYTLIVGPLSYSISRAVGHGLVPEVPSSLDAYEYTPLQRHLRPFELLVLAGMTRLILNLVFKQREAPRFRD
jgi:hypothetical protein